MLQGDIKSLKNKLSLASEEFKKNEASMEKSLKGETLTIQVLTGIDYENQANTNDISSLKSKIP